MSPQVTIDTPDYQFGVVNAQKLLATVPNGTNSVTVGVPPNAETLIVLTPGGINLFRCQVTGVTSGLSYAGIILPGQASASSGLQWFFDVSQAVDAQVTVTLSAGAGGAWSVYADAGVHVVADASKLTNDLGVQYVIPTVPNILNSDHPPVELKFASLITAASAVFIPAPGAGLRLRIFSAMVFPNATAVFGWLADSVGGVAICPGSQQAPGILPFIPQGIHLSTNASLNYSLQGGSGNMYVSAIYTVESV